MEPPTERRNFHKRIYLLDEDLRILIALSDSDQFYTVEENAFMAQFTSPYFAWPFLTLAGKLVWWVIDSRKVSEGEDPMRALRGIFPRELKLI
jgi:hypothetical protein